MTLEPQGASLPGSFSAQLAQLSDRILEALDASSPSGAATAWSLRLKLKAPLSHVYLALGRLLAEGKVSLAPEGLTYRVAGGEPAGRAAVQDVSRVP